MDPGPKGLVLPSLPGSPTAPEPQAPAPANLNKASLSFHVFIEFRHFPSTIRPLRALGCAGAGVGLGWRMGQVQVLVPDWCHPLQHTTRPRTVRGGSLGVSGGNVPGLLFALLQNGANNPCLPCTPGPAARFERNRAQACNSVQDCPGPDAAVPHMELQQLSPALCVLRNPL